MFKKTLAAVLAVVMLVAVFAMIVPASAATPTIENIYQLDGEGVASTVSAGGPVENNGNSQYNYVTAKNIPVVAGDKVYIGPILQSQGYHMVAYGADGAVLTAQVKTGDATVEIIPMNAIDPNTSILCYTVPEGVASITPVISQMFKHYAVITKNAPFTPNDYVNYWEEKGVEIKALIGGGTYTLDPASLVDVGATGGVYAGRANNKTGSAITNDNLIADTKYFCTQGYVEVNTGDMVYFVGEKNQGYHLTMYADNKDAVSTVQKPYIVQYDDLGNNYAIYAYRIRPGVKYIRYTYSAALQNAGFPLLTINQPFTEKTLRMYAQAKGVASTAVDGLIGTYNVLILGSKRMGTAIAGGSSTGVHHAFDQLVTASLGFDANVEIIEHSQFVINMLANDVLVGEQTESLAVTMKTALDAKDYDIIMVGLTRRCTPGSKGDVDASEKAALAKIMPSLKAETNEIYLFADYGDTAPKTFTTEGGVVNYTDTGATESYTLADSTAYLTGLATAWAEEFDCGTILYGDLHVKWVAEHSSIKRTDGRVCYAMACAMYNNIFGEISANCEFINGFSDASIAETVRNLSKATNLTVFPKEAINLEVATPETPETPENPDTSDAMIALVAFVAMISLAGVVVLGKKVRN